MFIETEPTQDPATLKFLPGRQVLAEGTLNVRDKTQASASPLAERLFAIQGVSMISCGSDFITITKNSGDWQRLKPLILGAIMEHFMSGAPLLRPTDPDERSSKYLDPVDGKPDLVELVRDALREVIDPELGYNIVDLGLVYAIAVNDSGCVHVTMTTTTRGCPATGYLRQGASDRASNVPGANFINVDLTYEPPWTSEMMSPEAKAYFGIRD